MLRWLSAKLNYDSQRSFLQTAPLRFSAGAVSFLFAAVTFAQTTAQGAVGNSPAPKAPIAPAQTPASSTSTATASAPNAPAENIRVLMVPAAETTLVAQSVGRIDRLSVQMGSSFRAGQTLLTFDCSENDAKLRMAQAEYNAAKEQHDAKVRLQSLNAAGDVEVQLAASAAERAKAAIAVSQTQTRLCRVDAPFAGRIVKLHVKQFQGVNTGQPLLELVAGDR